jgi:hypothetical protein
VSNPLRVDIRKKRAEGDIDRSAVFQFVLAQIAECKKFCNFDDGEPMTDKNVADALALTEAALCLR